jgi:putative flippase GtrA
MGLSRRLTQLRNWLTPAQLWHFAKYAAVGLFGFALNASLVWAGSHYAKPQLVSGVVFVLCGQISFFLHAGLTWRTARERKLSAAWVLFIGGNWTAGGINAGVFALMLTMGAANAACYFVAMLVSVPLTYCWNALWVFRKETLPKERILRLWEKLVEWNKTD